VTQADFKGLLGAREKPVQARAGADSQTAADVQTDTQASASQPRATAVVLTTASTSNTN